MIFDLAQRAFAAYVLLAYLSSPAITAPLCRNGEQAVAEFFTGWWCPTCNEARMFLYHNGISFHEYRMQDEGVREKLFQRSGRGMTPTIYICKKWVFGFGEKQKKELEYLLDVQSAARSS